jgi:[acyl-carrier-protein] S-malonyltransferase
MQQIGALFPGQGSQYVGMGKWLWDGYPVARRAFEEADDALDFPLSRLIFEGPGEQLEATEWQQPAILTVSVAAWRVVEELSGPWTPTVGLGLSLGEYSAYVASGVMGFADAVRLTRIRGRAMQTAVPSGRGGMLAIIGLSSEMVEALCVEAGGPGVVEPANYNAPGQTVASGLNEGLDRLAALVAARGGKGIRLSVTAPFHSSLLASAGDVLAEALNTMTLERGRFGVLANVDVVLCREPEAVIPRLISQVSHPVRFEAGLRAALVMGATAFLELGPGHSLANLVKKIDRTVAVVSVENSEGMLKALELLEAAKL